MRRIFTFVLLLTLLTSLSATAEIHDYAAGQTVVVSFQLALIRTEPSTGAQVVTTVAAGEVLRIIDGTPVQADGLTWWNVKTQDEGATGWLPDSNFIASTANVDTEPSCWSEDQVSEIRTGGAPTWTAPPAMAIDPENTYIATISTTKGKIILQLDAANAPIATNNFICLANAGYYDGTIFHRISSDFLIQGGDATGTGTGNPGYVIPSDPTTGDYPEGSIALANSKPDENGSQFFIAVSNLTGKIPDDYPVFGYVVSGQDVVTEISRAPVETNSRGEISQPRYPTNIISIEISRQDDEVGPQLPTIEVAPDAPPIPTVAVAPTVALPPTSATVIELDAKDIAFAPTRITIYTSNLPATIRMTNTGAALHNFEIASLDIDVDVQPGESVDLRIPVGTSPGTYDFICNVPGHKQAGMVGKLIVILGSGTTSAIQTTAPVDTCAGFAAYQRDYDDTWIETFDAYPVAAQILDSGIAFTEMTSFQYVAISDLFAGMARALELLTPPTYAYEWHQLQVDAFLLFAKVTSDASEMGVAAASIINSSEQDRIERATANTLQQPNSCQEFIVWATDNSWMLD